MDRQWVVFDAMGVIFEVGDDTNDLLVPFIQEQCAVTRERINESYLAASRGEITSCRFWQNVGLGASYPAIEQEYLDSRLTLDMEFLPVAGRLAGRYALGLLSNDVAEWSVYLRKRHQLGCFTTVVVSGLVGCRKPEPGIFEIFLKQAGTSPDNCLFVDDRTRNLQAAQTLGFRTVHFQRSGESGEFSPDARVTSFAQLESALDRVWGTCAG